MSTIGPVIGRILRSISLPTLIGSAVLATITFYDGKGLAAALFVFVTWYLIIQLFIWIAVKARALLARWRGQS